MSENPLAFMMGGSPSDQIVPPKGNATWLTGTASGAMAFIAVFALTLSLALGHLADYWSLDLAQSATVQIVAEGEALDLQTEAALQVLRTTPGVASAEIISDASQIELLTPWLGEGISTDTLPLPRLINVQIADTGLDGESLLLRLKAEAPDASYNDHSFWRAPILEASNRLRLMVAVSLGLTALITVIIVVLSANTALASNQGIIRTLRLLGARDSYIAQAFVRRITLRATFGAGVGMILALIAVLFFPSQPQTSGLLSGLELRGLDWVYPLVVPVLVGISAFVASRMAAHYHLRREI